MIEKLDSADSLAKFLSCSQAAVRKWCRVHPDFPRLHVGRAIRFNRQEVVAWLQEQGERKRAEKATKQTAGETA